MKKFNINQFNPCLDAIQYYNSCKSSKKAWNNCPRGDWMLWIALKLGVDVKILTLAKVHCALTVRHLMKDKRSINALEVALKFADDKATLEELKVAADAAYIAVNAAYIAVNAAYIAADATAYAAYAAYAIYAANTAAYTAANIAAYAAADAAAYAATYTAYANYATYTAYIIYDNAAKIKNQLETANICRKYLTEPVFKILSF